MDFPVYRYETVYAKAFRRKRLLMGLDATTTGALIHDAFSGNKSDRVGERALRDKFCTANNLVVFDSVPGGWSAHGQPCDAVHQYYRSLSDAYQSVALGLNRNPLLRSRLDELLHGSTTFGKKSLDWRQVLDGDIWAWQNMPAKLFRYAWVSRGYIDYKTLAKVLGTTEGALAQEDAEAKAMHKDVLDLNKIPDVKPKRTLDANTPTQGESVFAWQRCETNLESDGGSKVANLLNWERLLVYLWGALGREISRYKKLEAYWTKRVTAGCLQHSMCVHMYIHCYIHVHTHIQKYVHTYVHIYIRTYIHTDAHTYIHMHLRMYIHTHVCMYVYVQVYVCIAHIHMHKGTYIF